MKKEYKYIEASTQTLKGKKNATLKKEFQLNLVDELLGKWVYTDHLPTYYLEYNFKHDGTLVVKMNSKLFHYHWEKGNKTSEIILTYKNGKRQRVKYKFIDGKVTFSKAPFWKFHAPLTKVP